MVGASALGERKQLRKFGKPREEIASHRGHDHHRIAPGKRGENLQKRIPLF